MTVYAAITSGEYAVGAPITTSLAGRWSNNCLAIQENDPTAPDVVYAVTAGNGVTNGDTHDHAGGDGSVIPIGGIGAGVEPWIMIDEETLSGSTTTVTLTGIVSTYKNYKVVYKDVALASGGDLYFQWGNGSLTASGYYISTGGGPAYIGLLLQSGFDAGNAANRVGGVINSLAHNITTTTNNYKMWDATSVYARYNGGCTLTNVAGFINATAGVIDRVGFYCSANITQGTFELWGTKR